MKTILLLSSFAITLLAPRLDAAPAQTDTPDIEARVAETLAKTTERQEQVLRRQLLNPSYKGSMSGAIWEAHARYHFNEKPGLADAELIALRRDMKALPQGPSGYVHHLARLYFLYSSRSKFHPGRMSPEAEQAIVDMMFEWLTREAVGKIPAASSAEADPRAVWSYWATENHHLNRTSNLWSAANILKDLPAYRDKTLADGTTMAEMARLMDEYYKLYFREKAMKGLLTEIAAPSYAKYSTNSMYNLYDFADDTELKKLADQFLNLYYTDWAIEQISGHRGGSRHRAKTSMSRMITDSIGAYAFGLGNAPSHHPAFTPAASTTWRPDPLVMELALAQGDRGVYEIHSRRPGRRLAGGEGGDVDPDAGDLLRTTYHTPGFIMGMSMVPALATDQWVGISAQNRTPFIRFFDGNKAASVISTHQLPTATQNLYNAEWGVQDKGVMMLQMLSRDHSRNLKAQMVYLHHPLVPVERDGWVFVEAPHAYCAIKALRGEVQLRQARMSDYRGGSGAKDARMLELADPYSPILFEVNRKSGYESFAAFQNEVMANRLEVTDKKAVYASRAYGNELTMHTDYSALPEIDGKPVDLAPEYVYKSPYLNADFGKGVVEITKGEKRLTLDFEPGKARDVFSAGADHPEAKEETK